MFEPTAITRFRESATRLPEPCELSPRPIRGQLELPLCRAGYVPTVEELIQTMGLGPEGAR